MLYIVYSEYVEHSQHYNRSINARDRLEDEAAAEDVSLEKRAIPAKRAVKLDERE